MTRRSGSWILVVLLLLLTAHHLAKGAYYLAIQEPASAINDFRTHQRENSYFLDGVWPLSQHFLHVSRFYPHAPQGPMDGADPTERYGMLWQAHTPPWVFPLQFVVYPPVSEPFARIYLLLLNVTSVVLLAILSWRLVPDANHADRLLMALGTTAISAINSTCATGQNGLAINLVLAGLLLSLSGSSAWHRTALGGVCLAIALLKPSLSAPFALVLLFQRRWVMLSIAGGITLTAWGFAVLWTGLTPITQLRQFDLVTQNLLGAGHNAIESLLQTVLADADVVRNALMLAGLLAATLATWRLRRSADLLVLFAVLSVVARFWTYHRSYDDVLLVFLLMALGREMFTSSKPMIWAVLWLLVGLTTWPPYSLLQSPVVYAVQAIVWVGAAAALGYAASARASARALATAA